MELLLGIVVGGAAVWFFQPLIKTVWSLFTTTKKDDDDSTS